MTRVYDCTRSLLVAMLMHASLTTCMIVFGPSATGNRVNLRSRLGQRVVDRGRGDDTARPYPSLAETCSPPVAGER